MRYICIIFLFIISYPLVAAEYKCKCHKGHSKTYSKQDTGEKSEEDKKCIKETIIVDYEDGYISLIYPNGQVINFDTINEKEKFITGSSIEDKKNYTKIYFNRISKTLRYTKMMYSYVPPLVTSKKTFESIIFESEYNLKFKCN